MTRARFLLLSFLTALGSLIGLNREAFSRRWLERNGFKIYSTERKIDLPDFQATRYIYQIRYPKAEGYGSFAVAAFHPFPNPCWDYLVRSLSKNDFTIVQKH